jgi:hypothetical protein
MNYHEQNSWRGRHGCLAGRRGAITLFSAVLILILLTEVILYATQVGVFEQRKSANDLRQKQAFHAAEAGLQHAKEFFLANAQLISYPGDGGWLNDATPRWEPCPCRPLQRTIPAMARLAPDHERFDAIYGGTFSILRKTQYFRSIRMTDWAWPPWEKPSKSTLLAFWTSTTVRPKAIRVQGCSALPGPGEHIYFMLTLLARGNAACEDPTDRTTCEAEALIAQRVGSFGPAAGDGGPGVPLTTRSNFPPGGTAELVPNSNGGGPGVPISAWINGRPEGSLCPQQEAPIDPSSGSWSTCEPHEWYGVDSMPEDFACPTANCSCGTDEKRISYAEGGGKSSESMS